MLMTDEEARNNEVDEEEEPGPMLFTIPRLHEWFVKYLENGQSFDLPRENVLKLLQGNTHAEECRESMTGNGNMWDRVFVSAASWNHLDVMEALLEKGLSIEATNVGGRTALIEAAWMRNKEAVCFLLDRNANINATDTHGNTSLIMSCKYSNPKIPEILLKRNADPDIQNIDGETALMNRAKLYYGKEIVSLLLSFNANTELRDKNGRTVLDHAATYEIKDMLLNHVSNNYLLK